MLRGLLTPVNDPVVSATTSPISPAEDTERHRPDSRFGMSPRDRKRGRDRNAHRGDIREEAEDAELQPPPEHHDMRVLATTVELDRQRILGLPGDAEPETRERLGSDRSEDVPCLVETVTVIPLSLDTRWRE